MVLYTAVKRLCRLRSDRMKIDEMKEKSWVQTRENSILFLYFISKFIISRCAVISILFQWTPTIPSSEKMKLSIIAYAMKLYQLIRRTASPFFLTLTHQRVCRQAGSHEDYAEPVACGGYRWYQVSSSHQFQTWTEASPNERASCWGTAGLSSSSSYSTTSTLLFHNATPPPQPQHTPPPKSPHSSSTTTHSSS